MFGPWWLIILGELQVGIKQAILVEFPKGRRLNPTVQYCHNPAREILNSVPTADQLYYLESMLELAFMNK